MQHCGQAFSRDFAFMTSASAPSSSSDSDLQLVERTVAGDQRAYELLVIKYQRRIERLIARMVRDPDLVQDIAQDGCIDESRVIDMGIYNRRRWLLLPGNATRAGCLPKPHSTPEAELAE